MRKTVAHKLCATTLTGLVLAGTISTNVAANAAPANNNQAAAAYQETTTNIPLDDSAFEAAKKAAEAQGFTVNVTEEDPTVTDSSNLDKAKADAQAKLDASKKTVEDIVAKWQKENAAAEAANKEGLAKLQAANDRLAAAVTAAKEANC